jgi:DNA-binding NtrC family response regulator
MSEPHLIRFLIVDAQQSICSLCATIGQGMGLVCSQAKTAEEALERAEKEAPDLMLADLVMGKMTGLELLAEVKTRSPFTEVALMSAYGTMDSALQAMRLGAYDFVVKPFRVEQLKLLLGRMVEKVRLVRENKMLRMRLQSTKSMPVSPVLCTDLEELERFTVQRVIEQVDGDKELAQKLLGVSRATLYRKIKRYGIQKRPARRKVPESEIRGRRSG